MSGEYPYKRINFIRETKPTENAQADDGISIKQFYEQVVNCQEETLNHTEHNQLSRNSSPDKTVCLPKTNWYFKSKTKKQIEAAYLQAAEENNLEVVRHYIALGFNIDVLDAYKWSSLMIAIYASNIQIVEYLLQHRCNVSVHDKAGNNAIKLAFKKYDKRIIDMLIKYTVKTEDDKTTSQQEQLQVHTVDGGQSVTKYCISCDTSYDDQSSHLTSIVHLLNEYEMNPDLKSKILGYKLDESNRGFQLLIKNGWSVNSGIGANEDGRMNPVKAVQKLDRLGFGSDLVTKPSSASTRIKRLSLLKPNDHHIDTYTSAKDIEKKHQKERQFERRMRRYFDS
jgi:hypothetical protein